MSVCLCNPPVASTTHNRNRAGMYVQYVSDASRCPGHASGKHTHSCLRVACERTTYSEYSKQIARSPFLRDAHHTIPAGTALFGKTQQHRRLKHLQHAASGSRSPARSSHVIAAGLAVDGRASHVMARHVPASPPTPRLPIRCPTSRLHTSHTHALPSFSNPIQFSFAERNCPNEPSLLC